MAKYTFGMTHETPRRSFIKATGIAVSGGVLTSATGSAGATSGWIERSTPTSMQLSAVSYALDGAYAVGHGGYVLEREGGTWTTVTDDGPSGNGNDLSSSDATDDGQRLWVVGASGEIGEYDVASESFLGVVSIGDDSDFSGPDDYTGNFRDVAVTGRAGDANVYVTDDSGYVTYSFDNGETWSYTTPGSGSTIPAIGMHSDTDGHCSDTNQSVFATDDGENWSKIGVGGEYALVRVRTVAVGVVVHADSGDGRPAPRRGVVPRLPVVERVGDVAGVVRDEHVRVVGQSGHRHVTEVPRVVLGSGEVSVVTGRDDTED
jgi:hypothetical protein